MMHHDGEICSSLQISKVLDKHLNLLLYILDWIYTTKKTISTANIDLIIKAYTNLVIAIK